MNLLDLKLVSDRTHEPFGARVGIECGGVAINANGIFGKKEAEVIARAILRGVEMLPGERREEVCSVCGRPFGDPPSEECLALAKKQREERQRKA